MSPYAKHAPKHRAPSARRAPRIAPKKVTLKTSLTLSSMAVVATGLAVGAGSLGGVLGDDASGAATRGGSAAAAATSDLAASDLGASDALAAAPKTLARSGDAAPDTTADEADRTPVVTRSTERTESTDPRKVETLSLGGGNAVSRTEDMSDEDPRTIAQALLTEFGFDQDQFGCLDSLWTRESNWRVNADNPSSSAYGIPQALPGSKMSSAGADWATNPVTQIRWGLGYIRDRYGSPCSAWGHSESQGFY